MRRPDGTIDPLALYTYRKTGLDEAIKRELNPNGNTTLEAGVIDAATTVKALIDETIEGALGNTKGWTEGYLGLYSKLSPKINQAGVARVLKKSLTQEGNPGKQTPRMLAKAMDAEEVAIQQAKVKGDTFEEVFDPQQVQLLDELRAGVGRTVRNDQLETMGSATVREATQGDKPQIGNALVREIMIANKIFQNMAASRQKEITNHIEELFTRDPQQGYQMLANALKDARPAVKKSLLDKVYAVITRATATTAQKAARGVLPVGGSGQFAGGVVSGYEDLISEE
jgi:hypothetical protein